jgi:hypothetical protein
VNNLTAVDVAAVTNITCCAVSKAADLLALSRKGCLTPDKIGSGALFQAQAGIVSRFVPIGTLITAGFVSSAVIDLNSFSDYANPVIGIIRINGSVVGVMPETTVADVDELIDALVTAIGSGGSGYTAVNNGDGTITVIAPSSSQPANGFIITILLNPDFELETQVSLGASTSSIRQFQHIEQGGFNGVTAVANIKSGRHYVDFLYNQAVVASLETYPNPINGSGVYALAYRPSDDSVITVANLNTDAWRINSTFSYASSISGIKFGVFALYNSVNDRMYFVNPSQNRVNKLAPDGTITNIATTGLYNPNPITNVAAINEDSGEVWVLGTAGANGIRIIDPTTDAITSINTGADQPWTVTYYPGDGTPGSERMFVGFSTFIREYDASGAVITATWYSSATSRYIFYSNVYGVLFISNASATDIIRMDATLKQSLAVASIMFQEDVANKYVLSVSNPTVNYFILTTDGTDKFTATLENGTPDVFTDEDTNCISESAYSNAVQMMTKECGCCGSDYGVPQTTVTPNTGLNTIYFGNVTANPVTSGDVTALGSVTQSSFVGTYAFDSTSPSEYKCIAYPAVLGTPSRFYDTATNFDVPMQTVYQIVINSVVYNIYVSSFALGGALTIGVTA